MLDIDEDLADRAGLDRVVSGGRLVERKAVRAAAVSAHRTRERAVMSVVALAQRLLAAPCTAA